MRQIQRYLLWSVVFIGLLGCTKKNSQEATAQKPHQQVNLAIWGNYFTPEQQKLFTEKTGIHLNITNYASNEELLAKLQAGASGYDVAVPSDYMVEIMRKMELLERIDKSEISNLSEVGPEFLKQAFDPANDFSVPYAWSMTGIAVQRDLFKDDISSWKEFFENPKLAGKISVLDDSREVLGAALKSKGYSYNATNPQEIKKAKDVLLDARKRIKMFRSDMVDALENSEVAAGQAYLADANQAWKKTKGKIDFIIPKEGTTFAIDNFVIVKGTKNIHEAHALINFLLQPDIYRLFIENTLSGPVVPKARELLPDELKKNKKLFPSAAVMAKSDKIRDLGESTRLYDEAWTEIKSK